MTSRFNVYPIPHFVLGDALIAPGNALRNNAAADEAARVNVRFAVRRCPRARDRAYRRTRTVAQCRFSPTTFRDELHRRGRFSRVTVQFHAARRVTPRVSLKVGSKLCRPTMTTVREIVLGRRASRLIPSLCRLSTPRLLVRGLRRGSRARVEMTRRAREALDKRRTRRVVLKNDANWYRSINNASFADGDVAVSYTVYSTTLSSSSSLFPSRQLIHLTQFDPDFFLYRGAHLEDLSSGFRQFSRTAIGDC